MKLICGSYTAPLTVELALILYLAAPVRDRRDMAQFYVRHSGFSSDFLERVCLIFERPYQQRLTRAPDLGSRCSRCMDHRASS